MRACSFLPASTHMIQALGLEDRLVGVTFECPSDRPKVVRSVLEGHGMDSAALDAAVSEAAREGRPLYYVDEPLLASLEPDLVFTQEVCDVCQIDTSVVQKALSALPREPRVVPLVPRRLEDVYANLATIAAELGDPEAGDRLAAGCRARLDAVVDRLRERRAPLRRVLILEWMDPLYNCGHWIPDQITLAGGADALCNPGGYSIPMDWERVRKYDPEVLIAAPCGFSVPRAARELECLTGREGWADLRAVREGRAFLADAELFTQPSLPGLVDGVELLAGLFHPECFELPERLDGRWRKL